MVAFVNTPFVVKKLVEVTPPATRLVNAPFVAKRFVDVTEVPVASVNVSVASEDAPATFNVPVTARFDVLMPPNAVIKFVVFAPLFVMV